MNKIYTEKFDGVPVTFRQLEYLRAVERYWVMNGIAPTLRDLCKLLGVSSTLAIRETLLSLDKKNLVEWQDILSRTIRTKRMKIRYADGGYYVFW